MNTKKRHCPRSILAAAALLAALAVASCDNSYGIYTNIQQEKAQTGTKVFKETTCTNAFKLGTNYYATTAQLYSTPVHTSSTTASWSLVDISCLGTSATTYTLRSAVLVGSGIYALTGSDSSNVALSYYDGSTWTAISLPSTPSDHTMNSYSNFALDALYSANGELYAEGNYYVTSGNGAAGTNYYYLYHLSGTTLSQVSASAFINTTYPIRDVVYGGSTYYFASTGALYSDSNADGSSASSIIGNFTSLSSRTIWALSYTGSHLYVSTKSGYLYRDSGSASQVDTSSRPLTKVIDVFSDGTLLLVGTDTDDVDVAAVGYYEGTYGSLVVGSSNHIVASTSAIYSTTVSAFPVHQFYYDGDSSGGNLFVCISPGTTSTSYYGFYESTYSGSSWAGWDAQ